jgi:hypothetical protein
LPPIPADDIIQYLLDHPDRNLGMHRLLSQKEDIHSPGIGSRTTEAAAYLHTGLRRLGTLPSYAWLALLVAPLVIAFVWRTFYLPDAHLTFAAARNLAAGREWAYGLAVEGADAPLRSPLFTLVLALWARLGALPAQAALYLSALGWSVLALALYRVTRIAGGPLAAAVAIILAVFSPALLDALGTEATWAAALFWIAIAAALGKHWLVFDVALVLMLWTHFDLSTLTLAVLLVGLEWSETHRFPLRSCAFVASAGMVSIVLVLRSPGDPLTVLLPAPTHGDGGFAPWLQESELYWLYLPLMALGLLAIRHRFLWAGLLWVGFALAGYGVVAETAAAATALTLTGLGIGWIVRWIDIRERVGPGRTALTTGVVAVAVALLAVAQVSSLLVRFRDRPLARQALYQHVGGWLAAHSAPGDTLFGPAQIDYPADRPVVLWNGQSGQRSELSTLLDVLRADPPAYAVSLRTIPWDRLIRSGWFAERYEPVDVYHSPYDGSSPFTLWRYRSSGHDLGVARSVDVPLADGLRLVGYRYWPEQIEPGDAVYVTLSIRPTQPVTVASRAVVRVFTPSSGENWAQQDVLTPHSVPVDWWRTGQTIDERYVLTTTANTPVGAHLLDVFVLGNEDQKQDLGYVTVPWRGEIPAMTPVDATFSDQIELLGFEVSDDWSKDAENEVRLYWQALRRPDEDYTVFVHLVGPDGQPVTGHDGPPMHGRYPTGAWLPGDVVPDAHRLTLEPGLVPGTYWLKVGIYRQPSLERLPVVDARGVELADGILALRTIEIR